MQINLNDGKPVIYRPYRLTLRERKEVRNIISELLEHQESNSPYWSPIVLVKKNTGETRMCVDYRTLNLKLMR